jgi:hypothetical protein
VLIAIPFADERVLREPGAGMAGSAELGDEPLGRAETVAGDT